MVPERALVDSQRKQHCVDGVIQGQKSLASLVFGLVTYLEHTVLLVDDLTDRLLFFDQTTLHVAKSLAGDHSVGNLFESAVHSDLYGGQSLRVTRQDLIKLRLFIEDDLFNKAQVREALVLKLLILQVHDPHEILNLTVLVVSSCLEHTEV